MTTPSLARARRRSPTPLHHLLGRTRAPARPRRQSPPTTSVGSLWVDAQGSSQRESCLDSFRPRPLDPGFSCTRRGICCHRVRRTPARESHESEIRRRVPERRLSARALFRTDRSDRRPGHHYKLMEVCGGHTHTIYRYGVADLLPPNVELVHGPGCPVCVIPMGRVDDAIAIARDPPRVILTCFGDMMRVPGGNGSLINAEGRRCRRAHGVFAARRASHRAGKPRPRRGVLRCRL